VDTNNDGHVDRIRVQVKKGTQLSDDFASGVTAVVLGRTVAGFATGGTANDDIFDILLRQDSHEDTDVQLTWHLTANPVVALTSGLYGLVGGAAVRSDIGGIQFMYTTVKGTRPVITYTLAAAGSTKAYVHFSEHVYGDPGAATSLDTTANASILYNGAATIVSVNLLELGGNGGLGAHAAMITLSAPLAPADVLPGAMKTFQLVDGKVWGAPAATDPDPAAPLISPTVNTDQNLPDNANRYGLSPTTPSPPGPAVPVPAHNVSDVALNLVAPVFAYDQITQRDPLRGGIGRITTFDGTAFLRPRDTLLEASLLPGAVAALPLGAASPLSLWWDVNAADPILLGNLWIPPTATTLWPHSGVAPFEPLVSSPNAVAVPPNGTDRYHNPNTDARTGGVGSVGGSAALRDYTIPAADPEVKDGSNLQFLFVIDDGSGHLMPAARIDDLNDPRTARPWSFTIREVRTQRGQVTILHNVINPDKGEVANLQYIMSTSGKVTITVFDLKGDIVDVLAKDTMSAGEHSTAWAGKNRGGRIVARGIYFIRVVGPDFDEIRKVLVVR
jgi:hypothetical protein